MNFSKLTNSVNDIFKHISELISKYSKNWPLQVLKLENHLHGKGA